MNELSLQHSSGQLILSSSILFNELSYDCVGSSKGLFSTLFDPIKPPEVSLIYCIASQRSCKVGGLNLDTGISWNPLLRVHANHAATEAMLTLALHNLGRSLKARS